MRERKSTKSFSMDCSNIDLNFVFRLIYEFNHLSMTLTFIRKGGLTAIPCPSN